MSSVVAFLVAAAQSPVVQSLFLLVLGWMLKVGKDAAVAFLRAKGQRDVAVAQQAVEAAGKTADPADDQQAAATLARARVEQQVLDAIAESILKQDPAALTSALSKGKDAIPPDLMKAIGGAK